MNRALAGVALVAALALPVPVRADDAAVAANQLLAAQLMDAVTTRDVLTNPGHVNVEHDPAARPFVRTNAGAVAFFMIQNAVERLLFRRMPVVLRLLTAVEVESTESNIREVYKR